MKKLILLYHGESAGDDVPGLSEKGRLDSNVVGEMIANEIDENEQVVIWTSPAEVTHETADIIGVHVPSTEIKIMEKLLSDYKHDPDFEWLGNEISHFYGDTLIIVSHFMYVNFFLINLLGYSEADYTHIDYTQGYIIEGQKRRKFGVISPFLQTKKPPLLDDNDYLNAAIYGNT